MQSATISQLPLWVSDPFRLAVPVETYDDEAKANVVESWVVIEIAPADCAALLYHAVLAPTESYTRAVHCVTQTAALGDSVGWASHGNPHAIELSDTFDTESDPYFGIRFPTVSPDTAVQCVGMLVYTPRAMEVSNSLLSFFFPSLDASPTEHWSVIHNLLR